MNMTYILPLLLTIVPIEVVPYRPSQACLEVTEVLLEAVEEGVIEQKQAEEIILRCPPNL